MSVVTQLCWICGSSIAAVDRLLCQQCLDIDVGDGPVRAKSDWMQVFENDKAKAAAGLKYPATKYDNHYYAGVEVPATYEKEYHASIIRVGQLEAEVKALRAEVTRLAEWRLMVAEQGAMVEDGAVVADEKPASDRPTLSDHVEKVLEGLSQGMTTTSQEERLTRGLQDRKLGRIARRW